MNSHQVHSQLGGWPIIIPCPCLRSSEWEPQPGRSGRWKPWGRWTVRWPSGLWGLNYDEWLHRGEVAHELANVTNRCTGLLELLLQNWDHLTNRHGNTIRPAVITCSVQKVPFKPFMLSKSDAFTENLSEISRKWRKRFRRYSKIAM